MKKNIKAIGIMNGTSLDAIDYSLVQFDSTLKKMKFLKHWQRSIPRDLKTRLLEAASDNMSTYRLSTLHFDLGRLYGKHLKVLKKLSQFDIVGLHGQTIHHDGGNASLQIGHPGFAAKETGNPIYYDFRAADIVHGGQGAPFTPFFQKFVAKHSNMKNCAFHNLGGISNLTYFKGRDSIAFDTGPANILVDAWMQKCGKGLYDKGGKLASQGIPDPLMVNEFLKHPYFKLLPPKSTGREEFNLRMIEKWGGSRFKKLTFHDQLATLTELTALSIAQAYLKMKSPPKTLFFYGGGIFNAYMMERIHFHLPVIELKLTDDLGWPAQAFEASTFAFLAAARYYNKKVHLPKLTGAKKPLHLGSLYCL